MRKRLLVLVAMFACLLGGAVPEVAGAATWCGTDQTTTDRPDTLGGPKFHVIYATPADGADRFAEMASKLATDVNVVLSWWAREDPGRVPRFDLAAFTGCGSAVEALDISFVRLAQPAAAFHFYQARLGALAQELASGFADRSKKYFVVYDGAVAEENVCGSAFGTR